MSTISHLEIYPNFLSKEESDLLFSLALEGVPWGAVEIHLFGRTLLQPRLICAIGDTGLKYRYSGKTHKASPWPAFLKRELKPRIEKASECRFNFALGNLYRNGSDSMGWHSDNEKELGPRPIVASLSLGAERRMLIRPRIKDGARSVSLCLPHGSLLIMKAGFQDLYQHSIPKSKSVSSPRINFTFRDIQVGKESKENFRDFH